jgi:putative glutamine amidotransferase
MAMASDSRPIIGITPDVAEPKPGSVRAECSLAYCRAVAEAGGMPVILPPVVTLIPAQLELCRGFVLTGGDDPRMEVFGDATHAAAKPMHAARQEYEVALLRALEARNAKPVLGVCLGMQLMALCAGGKLNQHMPDDVATASDHAANARHSVRATVADGAIAGIFGVEEGSTALERGAKKGSGGEVVSHHRQAVSDPGRLRVAACAADGVIEAIDDPSRRFYVGVQWHPERTPDEALGAAVFRALVEAARGTV